MLGTCEPRSTLWALTHRLSGASGAATHTGAGRPADPVGRVGPQHRDDEEAGEGEPEWLALEHPPPFLDPCLASIGET